MCFLGVEGDGDGGGGDGYFFDELAEVVVDILGWSSGDVGGDFVEDFFEGINGLGAAVVVACMVFLFDEFCFGFFELGIEGIFSGGEFG